MHLPTDTHPRRDDATLSVPAVGTGTATAKTILFGEHAVVYGHPAIAVPITTIPVTATARRAAGHSTLRSALYHGRIDSAPERLQPTVAAVRAALEAAGAVDETVAVDIRSEIPAERGLGSSAAVAAAVVAATSTLFGRSLTADERHELIQIAERAAHGRPSGLDARAVVASGPVWFQSGAVSTLEVSGPVSLVLADSGVAGRTREAVAGVRALRDDRPAHVDALIGRLGDLSGVARDALAGADAELVGTAMTEAHALLGELGVGDAALDHLVHAAVRGGALGAKLTGGGRGGCVVAVARDDAHAARLVEQLQQAGAPAAWRTHLEARR